MIKFKGKFRRKQEGDRYCKIAQKSFRKTGKNLLKYDPDTIYIPDYKRPKYWYW